MNLMALIRMFTIRFRMEGAIGVVLLLLGLLGGVGMWSMLRIYDLHQDFMQVPWQQNQQLQQMQSKLDALQLKEKEVLITFSRSANLDDSYSQWKADVQAVQGQMQQISQTIDASQKTNLEKLGQSVQAYVDGFGPLVQSLQANPYVSVEETLEAANVPYQHLLAAQQALGALQMQLQEQAQAFEAKGASVKNEAQWLFLAAVLLTLLVVGPLTWMNMLAICRPLAQAQKLAKAIAMSAQALQSLFVEAKLGIGPPITDGFYYDFATEPLTPEDLKVLEKDMGRIVKERQRFVRRAVSDQEALDLFRKEHDRIQLEYAGYAPADLMAEIRPGETELKQFLQKNQEQFRSAEKVAIGYVLVDPAVSTRL